MFQKYPKKNISKSLGKIGQTEFKLLMEKMGQNFRENPIDDDYGIDGYIDSILHDGSVTGRFLAVQIKYGDTHFHSDDGHEFYFVGEYKH